VEELTREQIKPIAENVRGVTEEVREKVERVGEVVDEAARLGKETVERTRFYRDRVFDIFADIVSFWSGVRAGCSALAKGLSKIKEGRGGE